MLKNRRGFSFFVVQPADFFMNFVGEVILTFCFSTPNPQYGGFGVVK